MSANRFVVLLTTLLLALFASAGCGKKGQLYLPDQPRPAATTGDKAAPAAVPEDDEPSLPSAPAAP
jgi:predicted small lipoprotein YifL